MKFSQMFFLLFIFITALFLGGSCALQHPEAAATAPATASLTP